MADKYYTNVGEACLKVLKHHGVGIVMPSKLTCCGIPALASGDRVGFTMQTSKNLAAMGKLILDGKVDYILTILWFPTTLSSGNSSAAVSTTSLPPAAPAPPR